MLLQLLESQHLMWHNTQIYEENIPITVVD
jgi:hypothetical protein